MDCEVENMKQKLREAQNDRKTKDSIIRKVRIAVVQTRPMQINTVSCLLFRIETGNSWKATPEAQHCECWEKAAWRRSERLTTGKTATCWKAKRFEIKKDPKREKSQFAQQAHCQVSKTTQQREWPKRKAYQRRTLKCLFFYLFFLCFIPGCFLLARDLQIEKLIQSKMQEKENYQKLLFEREKFCENYNSIEESLENFFKEDVMKAK